METIVATDIFGNVFEPGDVFVYCPGSKRNASMRVGVFIAVMPSSRTADKMRKGDPEMDVQIKLVNPYGLSESLGYIALHTFSERASLIANPEFRLDSKLIQRAIQVIDDLKDSGLIRGSNERVSVNPEGNQ